MNLLYKLLPDFLKKLLYPEIYFEPEDWNYMTDLEFNHKMFKNEPCRGSLIIDSHCKGCKYEKEHT